MLKWTYFWVGIILSSPFILWNAIASLLMWDAKYFDQACYNIIEGLNKTIDESEYLQ